jgi:exonuclease SbcC
MIRLQKLILENVQSHKRSEFEFSEGLNILTGISDVGKSSVIRALRSLYYMGGSTKALVRIGEKFLRITAIMNSGVTVIQERGESGNRYILRELNKEDQHFSGFRFDVPLEIACALGVRRTSISVDDAQELNLSTQIHAPFMLEKAGTAKAQFVGSLTRLDDIDDAIRDTNKDIVLFNKEMKDLEQEKKDIEIRLLEFVNLDVLKQKYVSAEQLAVALDSVRYRIKVIENLKSRYSQLFDRFSRAKRIVDCLRLIPSENDLEQKIRLLNERVRQLFELKRKYEELRERGARAHYVMNRIAKHSIPETTDIETISRRIIMLTSLKLKMKELEVKVQRTRNTLNKLSNVPEVDAIDRTRERTKSLNNLRSKMLELDEKETSAIAQISALDIALTRMEKKVLVDLKTERTEELRKMGICPTCGTTLTEECINKQIQMELEH